MEKRNANEAFDQSDHEDNQTKVQKVSSSTAETTPASLITTQSDSTTVNASQTPSTGAATIPITDQNASSGNTRAGPSPQAVPLIRMYPGWMQDKSPGSLVAFAEMTAAHRLVVDRALDRILEGEMTTPERQTVFVATREYFAWFERTKKALTNETASFDGEMQTGA